MKLGFYLFAEYINMFISSALMATLYFGGYDIPFVNDANLGANIGVNALAGLQALALFAKVAFFIFFFMWVRWTIPRFRYDQLMRLGWKVLIPLALKGVVYRPLGAAVLLRRNLLIYGLGGILVPFAGIKLIDMALALFGWV